MAAEPTLFAHPARVQIRATNDELLALAKAQRALDPAIFEEFEPYFWAAEISSNRIDAYYTRMMPSSLRNYAADAAAGVAFQDSHRTDGLIRTFGHSLTGRYVEDGGEDAAITLADFYTLRGMDPQIDGFINKARAGITRDVSIGFYGGRIICSICGKDMWRDWSCPHIPGIEYEVTSTNEETGNEQRRMVLALGLVEDAHLAEVSVVYDGATPGAAILKAQAEAERGRIKPEAIRLIEQRYRLRLPDPRITVPGTAPAKEEPPVTQEPDPTRAQPESAPLATQLRTLFPDAATDEAIVEAVRTLKAENDRLRPLADDGTRYREDLITAALTEGVRAYGDTFAKETYEGLLRGATIETIKRLRDDWQAVADRQFPGGRQTRDEDGSDSSSSSKAPETPDAAYQA